MKNNIFYSNKKSIAVIRISSVKQTDGSSPEVQREAAERHCKKYGLELIRCFEIVESAKASQNRKQYQEAIRFAEKNKLGNILFYMPDRLSRNFSDVENLEIKILDGIFNVHFVQEGLILHRYSPDSDFMKLDFQTAVNKHFIRNLRTKVIDGMDGKAESGHFPNGKPPLGYIIQELSASEREKGGYRKIVAIDPNPINKLIVLREYQLRAEGLSLEKIRKKIIAEGLLLGSKAKLTSYTSTAIHKRLMNPFYRGKVQWKGKIYDGKHEVFIPRDVLDKVDAAFGLRGSGIKRTENEFTALMGGWLRCSCGCHIVYDPKIKFNRKKGTTKTYHYYHCANGKKAHDSLRGFNITDNQIWVQLGSVIDDISISPEFAKDIADALNQVETKAHATTKKQIEQFKLLEADLQSKEDRLMDMRLSGEIDRDTFDLTLKRIRTERRNYTDQIETLQLTLSSAVVETVQSILELSKNAKSFWNLVSVTEKKKVLDMILSNPILDGVNMRFEIKKPFKILVEMKGSINWYSQGDSNPCYRREKAMS